MGNIYQVDTAIQLNVAFVAMLGGEPTDPSAVTLTIVDPSGNAQTIQYNPGGIVRDGVGLYSYVFTPNALGDWTYKWRGTGAVIATSPDTSFFVQASDVILTP